jgi:hypothetical protein
MKTHIITLEDSEDCPKESEVLDHPTTPAGEREGATPPDTACETGAPPNDCASIYNCCDCGAYDGNGCGCSYCFACNACDTCR